MSVSGNYIEFPYRIVNKLPRRGRKKDCQCSACRKRPVITGMSTPLRKIRIAK